jgi:DNA-binding transcriptional ArsR family regulator
MTTVRWVAGSTTDLFLSLFVLHHAADFGIRPAWAAGVRQRLPAKSRETLEHIFSFSSVPLAWISRLPAPRAAGSAIQAVADLPPAQRIPTLSLTRDLPERARKLLAGIASRGRWSAEERAEFILLYGRGPALSGQGFDNLLNTWTALEAWGEDYLSALQDYQACFFAEEEARILPALQAGTASAQALAASLPLKTLVERLSRGVQLENYETLSDLTLLPSWWVTPVTFLAHPAPGRTLLAFGVRPEAQGDSSEAPRELVDTLKALGDPTRLRILRYLSSGPLSPSELARRLRLRPPTVIHHLRLLRFAGLVQVTVSENLDKRYAARLEGVQSIHETLTQYLDTNGSS